MIEVELSDGTIAEFPDGTPSDVIKGALEKRFPKKSFGTKAKEFFLGDDDPTTQNTGEMIGSALNKAGEAMTFGLIGDEASAAAESVLPGVNYEDRRDHYRQQEEVLERDNPGLALTSEIGGSLMGVAVPGGAIAQGASLPARMAASGAATGAMGGVYGFMEGEGLQDRAQEAQDAAKFGTAIGAAIPVAGAAVNAVGGRMAANRMAKQLAKGAETTDDMMRRGMAEYKAVDDLGVQIKPEAFDDARGRIIEALRSGTGFDELPGPGSLTPKTARVMQIMQKSADDMAGSNANPALPFRSLDQMRRQAGAAAGNVMEKSDQQAGMKVIEGLDEFVRNLTDDDVIAGDAKKLPGLIDKARKTWATMSKSQKIDDAMDAAENYRYGFSNGIKWQFKKILNSPKMSRGFSDAERRAMQRVVNGTFPEKTLELLGSGLTQVGGLVGAGLGMAGGGLPAVAGGLALTGGSMLGRKGADAVARKNAEIARALIASGKAANLPAKIDTKVAPIVEQLMRRGTAVAVQ